MELASDHPEPTPAPNQVLIKVNTAGINPLDWKICEGQLKFLLGARFPMILGNDVSGEIVAVGRDVHRFSVGDEVFCLVDTLPDPSWTGFARSGAYAELAVTREDTLAFKPHSMTHREAASVPLAALTAYQSLVHKAGIKPGDAVLINGASGGTGIFAVQMTKALGGFVTAVCSGDNQEMVAGLGADRVVDYRAHPVSDLDETYDIIYDAAAVTSFSQCRTLLKTSGVFISNLPDPLGMLAKFSYPLTRIWGGGKRRDFAWVKSSGGDLEAIRQMIDAGKLRTVLDRTYRMETIREAHDYNRSGRVRGKLVVEFTDS